MFDAVEIGAVQHEPAGQSFVETVDGSPEETDLFDLDDHVWHDFGVVDRRPGQRVDECVADQEFVADVPAADEHSTGWRGGDLAVDREADRARHGEEPTALRYAAVCSDVIGDRSRSTVLSSERSIAEGTCTPSCARAARDSDAVTVVLAREAK